MLRKTLGLVVLGLVAACTGGVSLGEASGPLGSGDGQTKDGGANGNPGSGPYDIECTFYHRPTPTAEFEEQKFTARSDASKQAQIMFSNYQFEVNLRSAPDAPGDTLLSVKEREVVQEYRLSKTQPPAGQLIGDHGFTGLVYLKQEMQYVCKATGQSAPPRGDTPAAIDIACQVELRTAPGGAIERSQVIAVTGPGAQTFDEGDYHVSINLFDDAFEGRAMFIDTWKAPATQGDYATHQLLQLDRNAPITNQLAGTTFTGRFALGTGTNKELSYACSSRAAGGSSGLPALGAECSGDGGSCAPGEQCTYVRARDPNTPHCLTGDPCRYIACAADEACGVLLSFPGQVVCSKR